MATSQSFEQELLGEFLVESRENLSRLDLELVELEKRPRDGELLASIFRVFHTLKGTCSFLGFTRMEQLAHLTESLLGELRSGERSLDNQLTGMILESVDACRKMLAAVESGGKEGPVEESDLIARLRLLLEMRDSSIAPQEEPRVAAVQSSEGPAELKPKQESLPHTKASSESTVRVDVRMLDRLMNLVGELVLTRNRLLQHSAAHEDDPLASISQRLDAITSELQEGVIKTRMQPIGVIGNKVPRMVRDLAATLGKHIRLEMHGLETELDRAVLEAVKDPLLHVVRNCCDHGIEERRARLEAAKPEEGLVTLRAFHEGGKVIVEISDDGSGIDPARLRNRAVEKGLIGPEQAQAMSDREATNLIFLAGFSTAAKITNVSGRGVGMDVVKTNIEKIGGDIEILSRPGQGTTVRIRIPLTLAIVPGLVVVSAGRRFVIPQVNLHEVIWVEAGEARQRIEYLHDSPVMRQRDKLLPLIRLSQVLGLSPVAETQQDFCVAVMHADGQQYGLIVDGVQESEEIVIKPLGPLFEEASCYSGATILGDGGIALIVDANGIGTRAGVLEDSSGLAAERSEAAPSEAASHAVSLLLVRSGRFSRIAIPLAQVARLEQMPASTLEQAAGEDVVQYRGRILPLVKLSRLLGERDSGEFRTPEQLEVVVCRDGSQMMGLVVDEVIDAVEDNFDDPGGAHRRGLRGSAVVEGKVTDFLDMAAITAKLVPQSGQVKGEAE